MLKFLDLELRGKGINEMRSKDEKISLNRRRGNANLQDLRRQMW